MPEYLRKFSYSRSSDQMCREDPRTHLSAEEEVAAEESLSIYCKPVELYNILQRRAVRNPAFLQRCLSYKIQAKHQKRIQMTISLSRIANEGVIQNMFPFYVLLVRLVSETAESEYSAVYRFRRACILSNFTGVEGISQGQATFMLPEISKLAMEAKSGSLAVLFISFAKAGGHCLWGKIPWESLYMSWEKSPNLTLGQRAEMIVSVDMHSCFLKLTCLTEEKCVWIQSANNLLSMNASQQIQVNIAAEEVGAMEKSPYDSYTCGDLSSSLLSNIIR